MAMCVSIMSELLQVLAKETIVGSTLKRQAIQVLNCLTTFPAGGNPRLYLDFPAAESSLPSKSCVALSHF